jgi:hypothetical protein
MRQVYVARASEIKGGDWVADGPVHSPANWRHIHAAEHRESNDSVALTTLSDPPVTTSHHPDSSLVIARPI